MRFFKVALVLGSLLPLIGASPVPREKRAIPDQYIVTLKDGITDPEIESHTSWLTSLVEAALGAGRADSNLNGVQKQFRIHDFRGYVGAFDSDTIESIKADENVSCLP